MILHKVQSREGTVYYRRTSTSCDARIGIMIVVDFVSKVMYSSTSMSENENCHKANMRNQGACANWPIHLRNQRLLQHLLD